jgi:isopropylmalate/homocitrate/citramalate synthase
MYGIDTGLKLDKLYGLSQEVLKLANHALPPNRQIVGDNLFDVESGIISTWFKNTNPDHLTEMFPFLPEMVGHREPRIVLGKGSGIDSVAIWLQNLEISASDEEMQEILVQVKATSLQKRALLTEEDFRGLTEKVVGSLGP